MNDDPHIRRRTKAVTSGVALEWRWWDTPKPLPVVQVLPALEKRRTKIRRAKQRFQREFPTVVSILRYSAVAAAAVAVTWLPTVIAIEKGTVRTPERLKQALTIFSRSPAPLDLQIERALASEAVDANGVTLRKLAHAAVKDQPSLARRCFHRLEKENLASPEDRQAHASLLIHLKDFSGARALLGGKPNQLSTLPPEARLTWIKLWAQSGDYVSAAGALETLTQCGLAEAELALESAEQAHRARTDAAVVGRLEVVALRILLSAVEAGSEKLVGAQLDQALKLPLKAEHSRIAAAQLLSSLSELRVDQRLAQQRLRFPAEQLTQNERQSLDQAIRDTLAAIGALSVEQKVQVSDYLLHQQEYQAVMELISLPEAQMERPLFTRRVEALLAVGDWREAGQMVAKPGTNAVPWGRALLRAANVLSDPTQPGLLADTLLSQAISEAISERRWTSAYTAARMALDQKLPTQASRALEAALRMAPDQTAALQRVIATGRESQTPLQVIRYAAKTVFATEPATSPIGRQLSYLNLLAGLGLDLRRGEALADHPELEFLEAFALHQRGEHQSAALRVAHMPKHRWLPAQAGIIGAILSAAGQHQDAGGLLQLAAQQDLFPEERHVVEPWLVRQQLLSQQLEPPPSAAKSMALDF